MSSINTFARHAAVLAAASGLVLTTGMAANAATAPVQRDSAPASHVDVKGLVSAPLTADSSVKISFDRPAVATVAAPVIQQPKPAAAAPAVAPAAKPVAPKATVHVQAAPAAAPAAKAPAAGARCRPQRHHAGSAAYRQVGITQDCTAMVEKALGAAGKPVGDIGPRAFLGLGTVVATPIPGDMVVQSGHVGIYAGNGQVVSGGMNYKNQTMVHPLSWLTATGAVTFVRA